MSHAPDGKRRRVPWLGFGLAAVLLGLVLLGPALLAVDPLAQDLAAAAVPPGSDWWLGTDQLGRSTLARTIAGGRLSLSVAIIVSLTSAGIGTALGLLTAELRGMPRRLLVGLPTRFSPARRCCWCW